MDECHDPVSRKENWRLRSKFWVLQIKAQGSSHDDHVATSSAAVSACCQSSHPPSSLSLPLHLHSTGPWIPLTQGKGSHRLGVERREQSHSLLLSIQELRIWWFPGKFKELSKVILTSVDLRPTYWLQPPAPAWEEVSTVTPHDVCQKPNSRLITQTGNMSTQLRKWPLSWGGFYAALLEQWLTDIKL